MPRRNSPKKHTPYVGVSFSCSEKRRYKNENEISKAIELLELERPGVTLASYHCPLCGGWHLTSRISKE